MNEASNHVLSNLENKGPNAKMPSVASSSKATSTAAAPAASGSLTAVPGFKVLTYSTGVEA